MIYILEFERPISDRHSARFYIGWAKDDTTFTARLKHHANGTGAAFCRAAAERGIGFRVVAMLPGSKEDERKLKNYKNTPRLVERLRRGTLRLLLTTQGN